jgi:DNA helicase HerA-like ATPase
MAEELARYRTTREYVEREVLPLATSIDGVSFELQASLHGLELRRGGYVTLETTDGVKLGQVTDLTVATHTVQNPTREGGGSVQISLAQGTGVVLDHAAAPFHAVEVRPADAADVAAWVSRSAAPRAGLTIGELLLAPGVPATLDSGGLARHTFMCGQSGSGKTYSLGVLLERVLAETSLRVVVLDPNSDYVRLGDVRADADPELRRRYADVPAGVSVWRNHPDADHQLRLRFGDLGSAAQAAVLDLHPVRDRDEYAVLVELLRSIERGGPLLRGVDDLLTDDRPGARELGLRAQNLGVLDWSVWSRGTSPSLLDELRSPTARCTVVDTGSLGSLPEQRLISQAVMAALWEARADHTPTLVVIDEAHNVCPATPGDTVSGLTSEATVTIAAEGRKYGLYLLISTQQPHKVHPNALAQCDNLLLMRMNSADDVADLQHVFSFVPPGLLAGSVSFGQGQALVAGKIVSHPAYVRVGERVSHEGGSDIPMTWAVPR